MTTSSVVLLTLAFCVALLPRNAYAASCQSDPAAAFIITASPCNGRVRTSFTLSVTTNNVKCASVSYTWDGSALATTGAGVAQVPTAAVPSQHSIVGSCVDSATQRTLTAKLPFTVDPPSIPPNPASGYAGSSFTIYNYGWPSGCGPVTYTFDGTNLTTTAVPADGTGPSVVAPAGATVGSHNLKGTCSIQNTGVPVTVSATDMFTVVQKPVRTSASATQPSNSVTPTTTPTTTPASTPVTSTPPVSSTPASSTPVPTTTAHHTSAAPTPSVSTPSFAPPPTLTLSSPDVAPGGGVTASGGGCRAKAPVHLSIEGAPVGDTVADTAGSFEAPLHTGSLRVGRHDVQADCGVLLVAPLDVVLVSQVSRASSTLAIIVFVLLVGLFVYRRRLLPPAPGRLAAPPSEPEELS